VQAAGGGPYVRLAAGNKKIASLHGGSRERMIAL